MLNKRVDVYNNLVIWYLVGAIDSLELERSVNHLWYYDHRECNAENGPSDRFLIEIENALWSHIGEEQLRKSCQDALSRFAVDATSVCKLSGEASRGIINIPFRTVNCAKNAAPELLSGALVAAVMPPEVVAAEQIYHGQARFDCYVAIVQWFLANAIRLEEFPWMFRELINNDLAVGFSFPNANQQLFVQKVVSALVPIVYNHDGVYIDAELQQFREPIIESCRLALQVLENPVYFRD